MMFFTFTYTFTGESIRRNAFPSPASLFCRKFYKTTDRSFYIYFRSVAATLFTVVV